MIITFTKMEDGMTREREIEGEKNPILYHNTLITKYHPTLKSQPLKKKTIP